MAGAITVDQIQLWWLPWCEWIIAGPSCGEAIGVKNWEQVNMDRSLVPSLTV